jgi:hypothetical protein
MIREMIVKDDDPVPTIDTLDWYPHNAGIGGERAIVRFPNGYRASCIRGGPFYTDNGTYEIAVMDAGGYTNSTPIHSDGPLAYQTTKEANRALRKIADLPCLKS